MTKKAEYIWIARDPGTMHEWPAMFSREPRLDKDGQWANARAFLGELNYTHMRRIFGITLRPGQCKRIKIEVTE